MRWTPGLLFLLLVMGGGGCSVMDTVAVLPASSAGEPSPYADLAVRTFPQALCTCEELIVSTHLITDAFQSSQGPWSPGGTGASIGTNKSAIFNDGLEAGGDLRVAGSGGITLAIRPLVIQGELRSAGPITGKAGAVSVAGDAWVGGDIDLKDLTVGGTLTLPPDKDLSVPGLPRVRRESVPPLSPPCPCTPAEDIAAYVREGSASRDNASVALDPNALDGFSGDQALELPRGRFYLERIVGEGSVRLSVKGQTALFVNGDVQVRGLEATLEDGAELDLFIAGTLSARERLHLGSTRFPAHLRIYLSGDVPIELPTDTVLAGNVYAPHASLAQDGAVTLFGALFVNRLQSSGGLTIHYDRDVLNLGKTGSARTGP